MRKEDAVHRFVSEMNCFPLEMINELRHNNELDWENVTIMDEEDEEEWYWKEPSWGWMWQPNSYWEENWISEHLEEVSEIGFVILHSEKYGYFIGMDAGGFDFYEAFWTPLYDAMGMMWHSEE